MSLDMDFFDWPQLAEHFGEDNLPAGLENISAPENNDVASLTWTDYFTPPNVSMMTYPEARQKLKRTTAISQPNSRTHSTKRIVLQQYPGLLSMSRRRRRVSE